MRQIRQIFNNKKKKSEALTFILSHHVHSGTKSNLNNWPVFLFGVASSPNRGLQHHHNTHIPDKQDLLWEDLGG